MRPQVLSDPDSRASYDAKGEAGVGPRKAPSAGDARSMFELLFGLADFEPYIGSLRVAEVLSDVSKANGSAGEPPKARQQAKRQVELAMRMSQRLAAFVSGSIDREFFCREQAAEARKLCTVR